MRVIRQSKDPAVLRRRWELVPGVACFAAEAKVSQVRARWGGAKPQAKQKGGRHEEG